MDFCGNVNAHEAITKAGGKSIKEEGRAQQEKVEKVIINPLHLIYSSMNAQQLIKLETRPIPLMHSRPLNQ